MLNKAILDNNPVVPFFSSLLKVNILSDFAEYFRSLLFSKDDKVLEKLLFLIGVTALTVKTVATIKKIVKLWDWLPRHIWNSSNLTGKNMKQRYGNCFVCITGFTEGIGRGYAQIFAEYGFNLLLIGIDKPTVELKVAELSKIYKHIRIISLVVDLSKVNELQELEEQLARLADIDIGIVVNNAGTLSRGLYVTIEPEGLVRDLNVDLCAIFTINRILVPRLRNRQKRSAIINMASCTGVYLSHRCGIYSSGKRSVDIYSRILTQQNKDKIDILSARPFGVATRMMKMMKGSLMITPRQCVFGLLPDLLGGETTTFGGIQHKLSSTLGFASLTEEQAFNLFEKTYVESGIRKE